MTLNKDNVQKFWIWFESIAPRLLENPTSPHLVNKLDENVHKLGGYDWEIGPWVDGLNYFAISPNLDIQKVTGARQIIEVAPICEGWHFLSSKPPKTWMGIWKMTNEAGDEIMVDSNDWEYILYKFDDNTFDIDILVNNVEGNIDIKYLAADVALTGYLGEEDFMKLIKNVSVVEKFETSNSDKATLLKYIKNHIDDIYK